MQQWPWFTIFIALGLAFSTPGRNLIEAFNADDQLAKSAAEPMMYRAIGILIVAAIAEVLVKRWLHRRKAET